MQSYLTATIRAALGVLLIACGVWVLSACRASASGRLDWDIQGRAEVDVLPVPPAASAAASERTGDG